MLSDKMLERAWKTGEDKRLKDPKVEIPAALFGSHDIHVGTDSQQAGQWTEFVTVIVVLDPGKGGRVFYTREKTLRIKSLRERLLKEVWLSVSTAIELLEFVKAEQMQIHVDANPDTQFKSSSVVKEAAAMVMSQGLTVLTKPDAWAAMHVADHVVKYKVLGR